MKALVLGGTRFLGRHLVDALCASGDEVTLLNRGRSDPTVFADLEQLHGDRDPQRGDGLAKLAGRHWDVAFDLCGFVPRVVQAACAALTDRVGCYVFVSSISVYERFDRPGLAEDAPLAALADVGSEDVPAHYGALKAACEREVIAALGERALIVRPGLIVGPFDPTDRFTYWPLRVARGGEVLAPAPPEYPVQFIDARDLAQWMRIAAGGERRGAFNATGPVQGRYTLAALLDDCRAVAGSAATITWVEPGFLARWQVTPWTELPLWPGPEEAAMNEISVARARAAGLVTRPPRATIADTLAWARSSAQRAPAGASAHVGLTAQRERQLLTAWAGAEAQVAAATAATPQNPLARTDRKE